jgi:hypothetical protein
VPGLVCSTLLAADRLPKRGILRVLRGRWRNPNGETGKSYMSSGTGRLARTLSNVDRLSRSRKEDAETNLATTISLLPGRSGERDADSNPNSSAVTLDTRRQAVPELMRPVSV